MNKKPKQVPGSFIAVADVHIEKKLFNIPELEEDLRLDFTNAVNKAIELNVEFFVLVGDTYEDMYPTSEAVPFVSEQIARLEDHGIRAIAIAGDHDKPVDGISWIIDTNRCYAISNTPNFLGVDYNDDPSLVMEELERQWTAKYMLGQPVHFIFLHGQVRELWPFCEEKKMLPIKEFFLSHDMPDLKGIILGDIHKPFESTLIKHETKQEVYIGYCGSLGVTRTDELNKKGYLYYDGQRLTRVAYELERKFIEIQFTAEWLDSLNEEERRKIVAILKQYPKKPIVILTYTDGKLEQRLNEIHFLYDHALVKRNRVSKKEGETVSVNLRSELKTNDKIEVALRKVDVLKDERAYELTRDLVTNPDNAKTILDKFREEALA